MIRVADKPGGTITVEGKEHLFFSGFSYLGVTSCREMRRYLSEGVKRYGSVFPSSRIGNVQRKYPPLRFDPCRQALYLLPFPYYPNDISPLKDGGRIRI